MAQVLPTAASGRLPILQPFAAELEMYVPVVSAISGTIVLAADDPAVVARFYGALVGFVP